MTALRCWAKRASDGALCERRNGHERAPQGELHLVTTGEGYGDAETWGASGCAPDAGPAGRETAALRILEVSHELDREAFLQRDHSRLVAMLRAISARLLINDSAAREDLAAVEREIHNARGWLQIVNSERASASATWLVATIDLLSLAADILRPFAEGR